MYSANFFLDIQGVVLNLHLQLMLKFQSKALLQLFMFEVLKAQHSSLVHIIYVAIASLGLSSVLSSRLLHMNLVFFLTYITATIIKAGA